MAAITFVNRELGLDGVAIADRYTAKLRLFDSWQAEINNNDHGIDGKANGMKHFAFCALGALAGAVIAVVGIALVTDWLL